MKSEANRWNQKVKVVCMVYNFNLNYVLSCWAVVAHTCNPSTLGGRGRWISEFESSLVYRVSSFTTRATQRNPVSKKQNPKNKTKQNKTKKEKPHKNMLILQIQDMCLLWFLYYFKDRQSYTAKFVLEKKSKKQNKYKNINQLDL